MDKKELEIYQDLEQERGSLDKMMCQFCHQHLFKGREIQFKRSGMKYEMAAKILSSFVDYDMRIAINILNLETGKKRKIAVSDIFLPTANQGNKH
jgi:hypothetical protein